LTTNTAQTLVTCLFDVARRDGARARPVAYYQANAELTLAQPSPLVAFVDPHLAEWVAACRRQFGHSDLTTIVELPLEELPRAERLSELDRLPGIENGSPRKDCGWHQLVNWSKLRLLAEVAAADPYGTARFAWMDVGLGHTARSPITFPEPCDRPTVLQMVPVFPEELDEDFHRLERGRLAGGFVRGAARELLELARLFDEEFDSVVDRGRRPIDQTVLSAMSARYPDLFDFTFGDYSSILINWDVVRCDERIVLENVAHCRRFGRWHEARRRCQILRRAVETGGLTLDERIEEWLVAEEEIVAAHLRTVRPPSPAPGSPPQVTVVLPATGGAAGVEGAARSVLEQTAGDLELVVVTEVGTDAEAVGHRLAAVDPRVSVSTASPGQVLSLAAAPGLGRAPLVAAIAPTDRWLPDKLHRQLPYFADPTVSAVSCSFYLDRLWGPLERVDGTAPENVAKLAPPSTTVVRRRSSEAQPRTCCIGDAMAVCRSHPPSPEPARPITIGLCMIVRNESAVIRRCLVSVRDVIDTWVIVDTGSTDDTETVIGEALAGVPGQLHHRPWRDFATNRSQLLELARGVADYLLLLDADMTLVMHNELPNLTADAYLVAYEGSFRYSVPRLVRGDRPWHYVGATHEYLSSDQTFVPERLGAWSVMHHADGGSRADKLTRDRALLEQQLEATPDDPRTVFYLAQTYRDLGNKDSAAEFYRRRVDLGGWDQEAFYAALQLGTLVADDLWPVGLALLVDAWEMRPSRAEPLYEIAVRARNIGDFKVADWATAIGVDLPMPDDILFVHGWVYEWGMRLERSIVSGRTGRIDEALALTDGLLLEGGLPDDVKAALHLNRQWLLQQDTAGTPVGLAARSGAAPLLGTACPGTDIVPLPRVPTAPGWSQTNPSIANGPNGLVAIARSVNYELVDDGYRIYDDAGVVRTVNTLVELDPGFGLLHHSELGDPVEPIRHPTGIAGFEDCRLFAWRDRWWAVATSRDLDPTGLCRMVLLAVGDGGWELIAELPGPVPERHEKNWMPFVVGDELHFVYRCRPFTVLRWDWASHRLDRVRLIPTDYRFAGLRGSSQGLAVDDGYLFVAHEAHPTAGGRRYLHRFMTVDGSLSPSGISAPFAFVHDGIEFCAGLARRGSDLLLSFGVEDRCAAVAVVPIDSVIDAIEPLTGPMS
jgi:glycosyltransferase involved in cell wall biosynthesis